MPLPSFERERTFSMRWNRSNNRGISAAGTPIPWVRVHKVPDYVQFPHMRHVNAGVTCQTCHGQVQKMTRVYQYAPLNMGWCINCHIGNVNPAWKARYDCSTCHY